MRKWPLSLLPLFKWWFLLLFSLPRWWFWARFRHWCSWRIRWFLPFISIISSSMYLFFCCWFFYCLLPLSTNHHLKRVVIRETQKGCTSIKWCFCSLSQLLLHKRVFIMCYSTHLSDHTNLLIALFFFFLLFLDSEIQRVSCVDWIRFRAAQSFRHFPKRMFKKKPKHFFLSTILCLEFAKIFLYEKIYLSFIVYI